MLAKRNHSDEAKAGKFMQAHFGFDRVALSPDEEYKSRGINFWISDGKKLVSVRSATRNMNAFDYQKYGYQVTFQSNGTSTKAAEFDIMTASTGPDLYFYGWKDEAGLIQQALVLDMHLVRQQLSYIPDDCWDTQKKERGARFKVLLLDQLLKHVKQDTVGWVKDPIAYVSNNHLLAR